MFSLSACWLLLSTGCLTLFPLQASQRSQIISPVDVIERLAFPNGYQLIRARTYTAHQLRLVQHRRLLYTLDFPSQDERQGFAVNWVRKTPQGFALSIEYGTRVWVTRHFFFAYRQHHFYLVQIRTMRLDKFRPEKLTKTTKTLVHPVELSHFVLTNYMPLLGWSIII
jgi:hypothetical protein